MDVNTSRVYRAASGRLCWTSIFNRIWPRTGSIL